MKSVEIEIRNESGLHARPAAMLVRAAAGFRSRIGLANVTVPGGPTADAGSLVSVLAAGVEKGHRVRIWAEGEDEAEAIDALRELLTRELDEGAGEAGPTATVFGVPAAPGIAVGPIWRPGADGTAGVGALPGPADPESRIRSAAAAAASQLDALAARLCELDRAGESEILAAQALMAVDPALVDEAIRLAAAGLDPAAAVKASAEASAGTLASLDDELLAARAADVRDVGARIARLLVGAGGAMPVVPSIAVAAELAPSLVAEAPPGRLIGVVLAGGSPTAHVAILARSLGIPAVVAAAGLLDVAPGLGSGAGPGGSTIAIDGETGEVLIDPGAADLDRLAGLRTARAERDRRAASMRDRPAATKDGARITLLANIRSPEDAPRALAAGAEGVGLFRTEYLFMRRQSPPTEAEQVAAYRRAMEAFGPDRPVVIRLADIGGDKRIPYLGLPDEPNPFLGVRAIRLAHGSRELLLTQLRAIWRAAGLAGVTPHAMAAMVSTIADARLLLELRDEARAAVVAAGDPCPDRMATGLMIEVPSAAILAPELARLADFFSIGTNDLTQYVLAADRGNPSLARLQDALHPAVLRTIASVVSGADGAGIPVAACGELAGDPAGALVLVGLGVDELSADAASLDGIRAALAGVTGAELRELAVRALAATDAETVRALAAKLTARG
ncbi:MAG: phosphoenolpyruvate--protein phosphotransferase [Candidatus Limnocylindrales bacterium]